MKPGALSADGYDTDKGGYLARYERLFAPLREREVRLLELGVARGGSLRLWRDYFPRGLIVGLDQEPAPKDLPEGVRCYQGRQEDRELLARIARECAPDGFDIIIDDCAHLAAAARASFDVLFQHALKPGGIYVIEDWGVSFDPAWPDGALPSGAPGGQSAGLVGFLKELIDHVPRQALGAGAARYPIRELSLSPGLAVVHKQFQAAANSRTTS